MAFGIDDAIGGITSLFGLFGDGGPSEEERKAMGLTEENLAAIKASPEYNIPGLDYNPQMYSSPETPDATTVTEDPNLRAAQMSALNSLLTRSNEGITAEEQRQQDLSRRKQEETSRGDQEAIINNMAARGLGGSGMEFALRSGVGQNAADTASQEGLAREATNAEQKKNALVALLNGTAGVRNQDYTASKGNADITNAFATENSRRRNAINQANTELSNTAQAANKTAARTDYNTGYNADRQRVLDTNAARTGLADANLNQGGVNRGNDANRLNNIGGIIGAGYNAITSGSDNSSGSSPESDILTRKKFFEPAY